MKVKLGERLKELRARDNISQAKLAEQIGIDNAMIAHVERGKSLVSIPVLILLAKIFNVSTDYLLGLKDTRD